MSVKNIIFDMGGVLVDFNPDRMLARHFPEELHEMIKKETFLSTEWKEMDRGTFEVDEAAEVMCSRLPADLREEAKKMILDHNAEMPPIEEMYYLVEALHTKGYPIYLLSNCPMWLYDFAEHIPVFRFFNGYIVSAEYKCIKPEKELYFKLFDKFNLSPSECFFIDDSPKNVEVALRLGMKGHCFADRDVEKLKAALSDEGVIL